MSLDRTKPPPFFDQRYKDSYSFTGDQLYIVDEDGGPCLLTLDTAWDWYDRITLPARVALLRELAAELETRHGFGSDVVEGDDYYETLDRQRVIRRLRGRADALEGGK